MEYQAVSWKKKNVTDSFINEGGREINSSSNYHFTLRYRSLKFTYYPIDIPLYIIHSLKRNKFFLNRIKRFEAAKRLKTRCFSRVLIYNRNKSLYPQLFHSWIFYEISGRKKNWIWFSLPIDEYFLKNSLLRASKLILSASQKKRK